MKAIRVLISDTYDPWFNLATEDWIFRDLDPEQRILFLWRNQPTVVIGRSQNPWVECHLEKMEKDQVLLARRQSGGGAVFHNLGNTNFTFLSSKQNYNRNENFDIIIQTLKKFNLDAYVSGRNDLVVKLSDHNGERKISGSAFRESNDRAFHHGTLLISTDMNRLQRYLNPHPKKLEAKGVASVRSRVINLMDLNPDIQHENLSEEIVNSFFGYYQQTGEIEYLDHSDLIQLPQLKERYELYKNWDWRFGQTFEFTHQLETRFDWGLIDLRLNVDNGIIQSAECYSDCLYPELIDYLKSVLKGIRYQSEDVLKALEDLESIEFKNEVDDLRGWLITEIG